MASPPRQPAAEPSVESREHLFEHPLNERMRSFLRVESVIAEARERMAQPAPAFSRAALMSLLELAALTERGELKREILSELERQRILLGQLRDSSQIDERRLATALAALEREQQRVEALPERLGQGLRTNEFLTAVRSRATIPGGTCSFDLPSLHCWLMRGPGERRRDLDHWLREMAPVASALQVLLAHTRAAAVPEPAVAAGGIYEYVPPAENPPVLLRIRLENADERLFPQVSAGRHRITIQFQRWGGADNRAEVIRRDVAFTLSLCRL